MSEPIEVDDTRTYWLELDEIVHAHATGEYRAAFVIVHTGAGPWPLAPILLCMN